MNTIEYTADVLLILAHCSFHGWHQLLPPYGIDNNSLRNNSNWLTPWRFKTKRILPKILIFSQWFHHTAIDFHRYTSSFNYIQIFRYVILPINVHPTCIRPLPKVVHTITSLLVGENGEKRVMIHNFSDLRFVLVLKL